MSKEIYGDLWGDVLYSNNSNEAFVFLHNKTDRQKPTLVLCNQSEVRNLIRSLTSSLEQMKKLER
jgi:hypothetical protein